MSAPTAVTRQSAPTQPQLSAVSLSMATTDDPQFQLPVRPAVVPGSVTLWVGDQLLIEGTGSRRVLSGRSARRILPDLLPLLDGTRTISDLAKVLGQSEPRVRAVLVLLFSCGLLQDGPATVDSPIAVLLARLLDTTRVNANVGGALRRLATARIETYGPAAIRAALVAEFRLLGMSTGQSSSDSSASGLEHPSGQRGAEGTTLAVVWVSGDDDQPAAAAARRFRERGIGVLMVGGRQGQIVFGPYSAADYGACVDCYLAQATFPVPHVDTGQSVDAGPVHDTALAAAALVAIEAVALIARVGTPMSLRGRVQVDLWEGRTGSQYLAPRPGCPTCGDPDVEMQPPPVAYQYETSVAFPPRRLVNPRDHQHHFEASNVALQFDSKDYPGLPMLEFDGADLLAPDQRESLNDSVSLGQLGVLLAGACGLKESGTSRQQKLRRWAPTGGNLGSPTAYLFARNVAGLPAGAYAYVPLGHRLAYVGPGLPSGVPSAGAAVTIVFTGALMRVAKKYRTFAYRVIHLDTGVALSHLLLLSRRAGLEFVNVGQWDDNALLKGLAVDRELEAVTAVVQIGGRNDG